MQVETFIKIVQAGFYTGVPDSQLKALCDYLLERYGNDYVHHQIAANEGNCVGLAAGFYLATHQVPLVYLQNSGLGNIINPTASLLHPLIYGIPCVFVIGWRGEPGVKDEPQHQFQGQVTESLLAQLEIAHFILGRDTTEDELQNVMTRFRVLLAQGRQVAFLVRKGSLSYEKTQKQEQQEACLSREEAVRCILAAATGDRIVCTTGKASRELFELREVRHESHASDFLTVGSMGHASSIALGIAEHCQDQRIWSLDGDGAALMHMGAMAAIGAAAPTNLIHVLLNNQAHDSVGGQPTAAVHADFGKIADGCGYPQIFRVKNKDELLDCLRKIKEMHVLIFLEIHIATGTREDLGRPTIKPMENMKAFMDTGRY